MKKFKYLSFLLVFSFIFSVTGNITFAKDTDTNTEKNSEAVDFKVSLLKDSKEEFNVKLDGKKYTIGETVKLNKGETHTLVIEDIPKGYAFNDISQIGVKAFVSGNNTVDEKTKKSTQEYKFEIRDDATSAEIVFYIMKQNYEIYSDSPIIGETSFNVYGKPGSEITVLKDLEEIATGKFDENGKYTVETDIEEMIPYTITSKDDDGAGRIFKMPISISKKATVSINDA